jgi:hypothetical protein
MSVRVIGASQSYPPYSFAAMLAQDAQLINEVWCWQTICPTRTSGDRMWRIIDEQPLTDLREKSATLRSGASAWQATLAGSWRLHFYISDNNLVRRLDLTGGDEFTLRGVMLGDLVGVFGFPVWVRAEQQGAHYINTICFGSTVCAVTISRSQTHLRVWSPIQSVSFAPADDTFSQWDRWRGFRRYRYPLPLR